MDDKTARWSQIVFWDRPAIEQLHKRELSLGRNWRLGFAWESPTRVGQFQLSPYWDPRMPPGEQENRLKDFNREIYPVWGKIWSQWESSWESPTCEPEIKVMHRCDWAIKDSGITVNRLYLGDPREVREKAAKAQSYRGQFDEAMSA